MRRYAGKHSHGLVRDPVMTPSHQVLFEDFTALSRRFTGEAASDQAEPFQFGEVFRWDETRKARGEKSSVCGAILLHDEREMSDTLLRLSAQL